MPQKHLVCARIVYRSLREVICCWYCGLRKVWYFSRGGGGWNMAEEISTFLTHFFSLWFLNFFKVICSADLKVITSIACYSIVSTWIHEHGKLFFQADDMDLANLAHLERLRNNQRQDYLKGSVSGSLQATDRLMKELRDIYRSDTFKKGKQMNLNIQIYSPVSFSRKLLQNCRGRLY